MSLETRPEEMGGSSVGVVIRSRIGANSSPLKSHQTKGALD